MEIFDLFTMKKHLKNIFLSLFFVVGLVVVYHYEFNVQKKATNEVTSLQLDRMLAPKASSVLLNNAQTVRASHIFKEKHPNDDTINREDDYELSFRRIVENAFELIGFYVGLFISIYFLSDNNCIFSFYQDRNTRERRYLLLGILRI